MLRPGTMVDRYRVEMLIGSGGMAFVYLATDLVTSSPVALKVLRRDSLEHQVRLRAEGELQGRLTHPNLVRVVAPLSDAPVLVLEYVEGPSLATALDEFGPFTIDQVDRIARDVLRGLAHAHDHGLVHRDLTLGNVLLDLGGDSVVARVTDFGLAKELDGDGTGTRSQVALGTPAYMAPEQIRDARAADPRADVYAAGALLYALLTGRLAFPQRDLIERYEASRRRAYVPILHQRPDAPRRMVAAVEAALAFERLRRPADGRALLALWEDDATELEGERTFSADEIATLRWCTELRRHEDQQDAELLVGDPASWAAGSAMGPEPVVRRERPWWSMAVLSGLVTMSSVIAGGTLAAAVLDDADPPPPSERVALPPLAPPRPTRLPELVAPSPAPPRPARPAPPPARVVVEGVDEARLGAADGRRLAPGDVPAGAYRVLVDFSRGGETVVAELELEPGELVRVRCVDAMRTCRVVR